jgi:hypothetical protein
VLVLRSGDLESDALLDAAAVVVGHVT